MAGGPTHVGRPVPHAEVGCGCDTNCRESRCAFLRKCAKGFFVAKNKGVIKNGENARFRLLNLKIQLTFAPQWATIVL